MRQISTTILKKIHLIDIGERLQSIARESRQDYIDYIGQLSVIHNSLGWWLTSVSEKNPFTSRVFLHICYLKVLEEEFSGSGDLVVICDSDSLMDAIRESFGARSDLSIFVHGFASGYFSRIGRRMRGIGKKGVFTMRFLVRIAVAKIFALCRVGKHKNRTPGEVFIHSWTDHRSFYSSHIYKDIYFGQLRDMIQKHYPGMVIISNVLPTIFYPKAVLNLLNCEDRIHLFENYLSFLDVFRALVTVNRQLPKISDFPSFGVLNISAIIREEIHSDKTESSRSEISLLHYYAGKRLGRNKHARAILSTFENHMWEKMFWTGIREAGANCRCIGYAHSIVSPWYLFYSLSAAERSIAPIPEYILVNGAIAKERLAAAGFDRGTIYVCGAFRYVNPEKRHAPQTASCTQKSILVIPTSGLNETIEFIDKAVLAFRDASDIRVKIKLHPTMPAETILPLYHDIPGHFTFTDEPVNTLLPTTDIVLFTESAVSIEALAASIPVLHIRSGLRIDMNIFEGIDLIPSVSAPAEIALKTRELFAGEGIAGGEYESLVALFFAPADERVVTSLLRPAKWDKK